MRSGKRTRTQSGRGRLILVIGGASSGKSTFALKLAGEKAKRAFVATGEPLDDEMTARIRRHQVSRGPGWDTAEVPEDLEAWFREHGRVYRAVVLDCLTLWLSNLTARGVPDAHVPERMDRLLRAIRASRARVVVVTNELGLGLVPVDASTRRFREVAGRINQQVGVAADEVYFVVGGLQLRLKPKER